MINNLSTTLPRRHVGENIANPCLDESSVSDTMAGGLLSVDLSGCGLTDEDHDDLAAFLDTVGRSDISSIDLSNNKLESLKDDLLTDMSSITFLLVNDNALETFPADLFQALVNKSPAIFFFEATNNKLVSLPAGLFSDLQIARLRLTGNALECLPEVGEWTWFSLEVDPGVKDCRYLDCNGDTFNIGNSFCTAENNVEECEWDGGDCCTCDCDGAGCFNLYEDDPEGLFCKDPQSECQ